MKCLLLLSLLALAATTLAGKACCGQGIAAPSLGKNFKPSLTSCPAKTTFVCSGSTVKILYENAANVIRNPAAELTCRNGKWTTSNGQSVKQISC